jgi:6-phosphogluconolactonase
MRTIYNESRQQACRLAAAELVARAKERLRERDRLLIAVPGGRSVTPLLQELGKAAFPFEQCTLFLADERVLPEGHPDRNDGQIIRTLRDTRLLTRTTGCTIETPRITVEDPSSSALEYTARLRRYGMVFDLLLLGVGEDGHVASLFPHAPQLNNTEAAYLPVFESPKPPSNRITVSPALIRASRWLVLLAFGPGKQTARTALDKVASPVAELPASLAYAAGDSLLVTDLSPQGPGQTHQARESSNGS